MKGIFYLSAVLITYGSLYPFNFTGLEDHQLWHELMRGWNGRSHIGDILGNIILFIPYGYFGMFSFRRHTIAKVLVSGILLALVLQMFQVYLPSRDANIRDVWWNLLGTGVGVVGALIPFLRADRLLARHQQLEVFPLIVAASWLGYRLMPFVPSIDWQQIKNSLKPLLLNPQLSVTNVFHDTVAWLVIALIWQTLKPPRWPNRLLWLAVPVLFALEVLIIYNSLSLSNVVGVMLAAAIWLCWMQHYPDRTRWVFLLLVAMLAINALAPFELRSSATEFHWIPFYGFLGGAMMLNTAVIFEKFFLFGAALWLLLQLGVRLPVATVIMVVITFAIEMAQLVFDHHLAEVTDPILVVLIGMLCHTLQQLRSQQLNATATG
ncbi:VanZ family protein [Aestuariirhabdus sp. Z084]|uniref:VanZ family protein n=1 Tax=Aestuariirhabdus haliotis TaxID=2918751 RepID=UPI00201B3551|nr:VanZ family protein [Aestuariirhabdus haliotis]MCL6416233.1 VanZ family protein [Aestuariirhabdus haliotis]MCL6420307.1 VanZ family protein [Aestuariirhabdus haliotis]